MHTPAQRNADRPIDRQPFLCTPAAQPHADDTAARIRRYVALVRPMRGIEDYLGDDPAYERGLRMIERMACSTPRSDPAGSPNIRLSAHQCADVLRVIALSEPRTRRHAWSSEIACPRTSWGS